MLMKCQSCHFISSNYRLACRPFTDHLQRCLQCITGSLKSHFVATNALKGTRKHAACGFLSQTLRFLVYLWKTRMCFGPLPLTCQSKAERDPCNYSTFQLRHAQFFKNHPILISDNFRANARILFFFFFSLQSKDGAALGQEWWEDGGIDEE